jgi:hypothetical protein
MKTYPNKERYYQILRGMSPQERLEKAFELSDLTHDLFKAGLKNRYPDLATDELKRLYLERLQACHNRNY